MNQTEPTPEPPVETKSNRSALLIVFLVVFIDLLGFGIVLPMLPVIGNEYIKQLIPTGPHQDKMVGLVIGLLMASFSLMQFIFAPIWGRLSDRVGRRPILLLGLAASVVFYGLLGVAVWLPTVWAVAMFFVARIGAGIAGATIGTAQAVIADSTPPEKRKHGMALIGAAFGIGFTFGPLIGFAALVWFKEHEIHYEWIGFSAAILSLVALILAIRLLPETRQPGGEPVGETRRHRLARLFRAMTDRSIGSVVLTFFLATLGFSVFEATLALFLKEVMKYPVDRMFLYFAYVGFVLMLTQGFLYRRLAKRLSEVTFMALGIVGMGLGVGLLALVCYGSYELQQGQSFAIPLVPLLFLSLTLAVIGFAFLTPSAQALISRRTAADKQGEVLGVNQSASALARIIGPPVGLTLYEATPAHLLPYAFGAGILLLMLPMLPRISRA